MATETEGRELDRETLRRGVGALLEDPSHGFYCVAIRQGSVVGQLMVTFEWSDWRAGQFWWIQSVYVHPEHRRTGVYRALHEHVVGRARAQGGVVGVRLYVERENTRAQRTYEALGMKRAVYDMFEIDFSPLGGEHPRGE
ncbi:MAG: N-acetyltransferase [Polyangiaceae bacterium]